MAAAFRAGYADGEVHSTARVVPCTARSFFVLPVLLTVCVLGAGKPGSGNGPDVNGNRSTKVLLLHPRYRLIQADLRKRLHRYLYPVSQNKKGRYPMVLT